jgi:hypothetical protein
MKDKNCMDPKVAAYCKAMRELEDKFHRLELHHVLQNYKKRPTYLRRLCPVAARCLTVSLRVINTLLLSAQRERSHRGGGTRGYGDRPATRAEP